MLSSYDFNFFYVWKSFDKLLDGLFITLELTFFAALIGLTFGFVLALMTMSSWRVFRWPAIAFIELFRCTPALIQIVWFFYCVPILFNVYWDALPMGIIALGLNLSAFNAEAYRAAIQAIPQAHQDVGIALGLTPFERIRYIVLPQSLRTATPVLITNVIGIFQQTALVAIVAVEDLMYQGKLLVHRTI